MEARNFVDSTPCLYELIMWLKRKPGRGLKTDEPAVHLFLTDDIAWIFQFSREVQLKASCIQTAILACGQVLGCADAPPVQVVQMCAWALVLKCQLSAGCRMPLT